MKIRYPITSEFKASESFRDGDQHLGVDLAMPKGTELRSIKEGTVEKLFSQPDGIGYAVYVKWENGKTAIYGHMDKIKVRSGDKVEVGDLLGYSGNTGNVVGENGGYHLHFGLKNEMGEFINPEPHVPLLQDMNYGLNTNDLISNESDMLMNVDDSYHDIFQDAMNYFSDSLQDMSINTIINTLVNHPVVIQNFQDIIHL